MASREALRDQSILLIPFYTSPTAPDYQKNVAKFKDFAHETKEVTGLRLAVVDDGCGIDNGQLCGAADVLVKIPRNRGKAQALRQGLGRLVDDPSLNAGFIVQYDGDGDQSAEGAAVVHQKLVETASGDRNKPVLVIGDRYALGENTQGIKTPPNPESVTYRRSILTLFNGIATNLGAPGIYDWVSGARGYTEAYAKELVAKSKSNGYGVESDQLLIASLMGADVVHAPLPDSRPRDPWTLTSKWLENFDIYDAHRDDLMAQGRAHVLEVVDKLRKGLRSGEPEFKLDLSPLGMDTKMKMWRWDDLRHAAEIPQDYLARVFDMNAAYPFTLKKQEPQPAR